MERLKEAGFQEIIPWLARVTDGIVVTKSGALLASYEIAGIDIDTSSLDQVESLMMRLDRAYQAFNIAPVSFWLTVRRYEYDHMGVSERFANPASQALYDLHRENVRRLAPYRLRSYLTIGMDPPRSRAEKIFSNIAHNLDRGDNFFQATWKGVRTVFSSRYAFAYRREQLESACMEFEKLMESILPTVLDLNLRRLSGSEFIGFLRSFVSDEAKPEDGFRLDEDSLLFLDTRLTDADLEVERDFLRLGKRYVAAISLKEWPARTTPEIIAILLTEPSSLTFSFAFRMLMPEEAKKTVMRVRQFAEVTQYRLIDYIMAMRSGAPPESKANQTRRQEVAELRAIETSLEARDIGVGYANLTILVEGDSPEDVEIRANRVRKRLLLAMPGVVREDLHLLSAYAATLPGQMDEPVRWALAHTMNLTDATWFRLPHAGSPVNTYLSSQLKETCPALAVLPTEWGTPYYFNFHDGALGHTLVIGPSRAGKSVFVNFLLSQWVKYAPCHVIIFDKDKSCKINALLHGGTYYEINPDRPILLNPLSLAQDRRHHPFLVEWVVSLAEMRGYRATNDDIKAIAEGIEELHLNEDAEKRRLIYLQQLLPGELAAQIDPYVEGGQYGYMFDNPKDGFSIAAFTCIEMGDILRQPAIAGPFLEYAFYRITDLLERNRSAGARPNPTLIYLEECWFLLENERFAHRIRDWLKTLAKMNACLIMTTQSMDDMITGDPKIFAAIRDNIPTKILLPNPNARTETLRRVYRDFFGVSEDHIAQIAQAIRNRNYLVVKPDHAKMLRCEFDPASLAYLRSDGAALAIFEEEFAKGPGWEKRYLARVMEV